MEDTQEATAFITVAIKIRGNQAQDAVERVKSLIDHNGIFSAGIAGVVTRRLCATGMIAGYPDGWKISDVEII